MRKLSKFNLFDLKAMYAEKDITDEETIGTIKRQWHSGKDFT